MSAVFTFAFAMVLAYYLIPLAWSALMLVGAGIAMLVAKLLK